MRTSNKILLGFFATAFLIPLFILMSFRSMIKKGQFVAMKDEQYNGGNHRSGFLKPYKVIKLVSSGGRLLKCNLQYSDSAYYDYYNATDSVRIYQQADTVFVKYINVSGENGGHEQFRDELSVTLKLPSITNVVVENAEATILPGADTTAYGDLYAEVYGDGLLRIGAKQTLQKTNKLALKTNDGEVVFGKSTQIDELSLDVNGSTSVIIEEGAAIDNIKGNISDSSSIKANWKYLKKFLPLTK